MVTGEPGSRSWSGSGKPDPAFNGEPSRAPSSAPGRARPHWSRTGRTGRRPQPSAPAPLQAAIDAHIRDASAPARESARPACTRCATGSRLERLDAARDGAGKTVDPGVGPARDGQMLEVPIHRRRLSTIYLFHVLHLRPMTWRRAQNIIAARKKRTDR